MIKPTQNLKLPNYGFGVGKAPFAHFFVVAGKLGLTKNGTLWNCYYRFQKKMEQMRYAVIAIDNKQRELDKLKEIFQYEFGCNSDGTDCTNSSTDLRNKL